MELYTARCDKKGKVNHGGNQMSDIDIMRGTLEKMAKLSELLSDMGIRIYDIKDIKVLSVPDKIATAVLDLTFDFREKDGK